MVYIFATLLIINMYIIRRTNIKIRKLLEFAKISHNYAVTLSKNVNFLPEARDALNTSNRILKLTSTSMVTTYVAAFVALLIFIVMPIAAESQVSTIVLALIAAAQASAFVMAYNIRRYEQRARDSVEYTKLNVSALSIFDHLVDEMEEEQKKEKKKEKKEENLKE